MRRVIGIVCILLVLFPQTAAAAPNDVSVTWEELEPLVLGQRVTLKLPSVTVKGQVLAVMPDSLMVDVVKSTNPAIQSPGSARIPRTSITTIELGRQGKLFRILAIPISMGISALVYAGLRKHMSGNRYAPALVSSGIGFGVGAGVSALARKLDRKITVITIQN